MNHRKRDTTYRDQLMKYLNQETIMLSAINPYIDEMMGKTEPEKEHIAEELLRKIRIGEIRFSDEDRYEISENDYFNQISSLLKILRGLPDGSELNITQLMRLAWDEPNNSASYWCQWLLYTAEQEGPELIVADREAERDLSNYRKSYIIKRTPPRRRLAAPKKAQDEDDPIMEKRKLYDWHDWTFCSCHSAAEVTVFFEKADAFGKKIASVQAIGLGRNMTKDGIQSNVNDVLDRIESPYDEQSYRAFPGPEKTLLPVEVELCEPVIVWFEDGDSLAIIPQHGATLCLGINQINEKNDDGLNHSNFNSELLFHSITGHSIQYVEYAKQTDCRQYGSFPEFDERQSHCWFFGLDDNCGIYIRQSWSGCYLLGLTQYNPGFGYKSKNVLLPYSQWIDSLRHVRQVEMVEGHNSSSYFWIMPVRQGKKPTDGSLGKVIEHSIEEISIEEYDVFLYLSPFLERYFDATYPYVCREEGIPVRFEWNLEHNLYTYETMERMLRDIEECAELIETDIADPRLAPLLEKRPKGCFDPETHNYRKTTSEEDLQSFQENAALYVDFYRRFVFRLRRMIARSPEFEAISFMGP